jgi:2-dehydropantoate 2-reductase
MKRIAVLGAGGVGGYFGARLAQAGAPVAFVARSKRADQLRERGIRVQSPRGDWQGKVEVRSPSSEAGDCDVVVVACKAYDLEAAIGACRAAAAPGARILPLLNGIRHLRELEAAFPDAVVWGGLAHLMVWTAPDGAIRHGGNFHTFRFGRLDGGADPLADELAACLATASIDAAASATICRDMWAKFQMLAALAGTTCLLRAPVGVIVETQCGASLMTEALRETAAIAAAEGFPVGEDHFRKAQALLTEPGSRFASSMLRDIQGGRPTEAAHIVGDMFRRAATHGIDAPILRLAWAHLEAYEIGRRRQGSAEAAGVP